MTNSRSKLHASHRAEGSVGHDGGAAGDRQVGVDDFREALNATNGAAAGGANGTLKRSTSRRFSRKLEDTATDGASSVGHGTLAPSTAGGIADGDAGNHDVAALLNRMHVGVPDDHVNGNGHVAA